MNKNCDLLIHNAQLITCAENGQAYGRIDGGMIVCYQGKITAIELNSDTSDYQAEKIIKKIYTL